MTSPIGKGVDKAPAPAAKAANQPWARGETRLSLRSESKKRGRSHRGAFCLTGVSRIRHYFFKWVLLGVVRWGEFDWGRFAWSGLLRQTFRLAPAVDALTGGVRESAFGRLLIAMISGAMVDFGYGSAADLTTIDLFLVAGRTDKE